MTKPKLTSEEFNRKYFLLPNETKLIKYATKSISTVGLVGKPSNFFRDFNYRLFKQKAAIFGLVSIVVLILISIIVPATSPYVATLPISSISTTFLKELPPSYTTVQTSLFSATDFAIIQNAEKNSNLNIIISAVDFGGNFLVTYRPYTLIQAISGQSLTSLVGTDQYGRDIWLQSWQGTRDAIVLSIIYASITFSVGVFVGAFIGFHVGKWIDTFLLRLIEIFDSIPGFLLLIILTGVLGRNLVALGVILILINWTGSVYSARTYIITIKDEEFLKASKAIGSSKFRIIYFHALPQILGKILGNFMNSLISGITILTGLAFLGILTSGPNTPPNLGLVLNEGRNLIDRNLWAVGLPTIILVALTVNLRLIAIGIHDALDPKIKV
ncbi:Oligopeptide ABC transporter, permease protein OppC [[Mycoplasma] cavipharyngis]|uniref:ABC transporter permease n=1 Tax=[Mycoplasma] cavipharyngis TaxID=92757 RepID=UPI003704A172